ncbi:DNA-repair protein XRCC1-like [Papaver somniferum]|uniref:DNA-repair protein XRCC1-like n=1 Tax=Papaver somniferum TaxID=3469 RepID=UPI000E6FE2D1|nr:DNA-repair protein XRCC1-like [Papaver somniferum]
MYEKEMLNEIAQRLPVEDVPLTVDWQEKFEDLEVKNEDLRLTIAEKWCELQSRKEDGLPIDRLNRKFQMIPKKSNEQGNATPTMPVMGGSEENLTQFDIEVSQFKIWARSDLERKVKELQEEKSMPEPSQTEKAELQQTAATQVLGNIEVEIGSLRDRQGASLEEMLPNMQFMPLVCELPSLKELHTVPMEKLIDLAIHGKGIYTMSTQNIYKLKLWEILIHP